MGTFKGSGHILICGWSSKGPEIIRELRAREVEDAREIVILADRETEPFEEEGVTFVRGNTERRRRPRARGARTRVDRDRARRQQQQQQRARRPRRAFAAHHARRRVDQQCRLLVRRGHQVREPPALRAHPRRRTRRERRGHGCAAGGVGAHARSHSVITDLLTHPEGQELYRVPVPPELVDQSARHALEVLKDVHDSLLVGVFVDGGCVLNPPSDTVIPADAELLVVRDRPIGQP